VQQIHDARSRAYINPAQSSHEILVDAGVQRASADGEVANVTYALANESGQAVPLLRRPPLGVEAVEYGRIGDENVEQFRGVVTQVGCGESASIEVTA
jgi:hypothetical protein